MFQQLRARVSEQLFGLGVDQNDFPGAVDDDHGVGGGFQQRPKLLFRFLAFADVPDGAHGQRAFLGLQGAETDFNGKLCSILAQSVKLEARAHGAGPRLGEKTRAVPRMSAAKTLRDEDLDLLAQEFFARVAEELFRLRIHQNDAPRAIDNDNCVRRGFQQTAEFLLGLFSFRDIPNGAHCQRSILGFQGAETDLHRELDAILAPAVKLQTRAHRAGARLRKIVRPMSDVAGTITLRQQHLDGLATQCDAFVTE